jgi:KUP system potassium uptake protein
MVDVTDPTYYVSRMSLKRTAAPGMRPWRKRLFLIAAKSAVDPIEFFGLPDDRVVILGARVGV